MQIFLINIVQRNLIMNLKSIKFRFSLSRVNPVLERYESALLMILGFGGFSILLAVLHNSVRKYIFHDEHNLDTTFDAGGNVSLSLTAVTVASQLFWPGDILHSATLTTKVNVLMIEMPVLFHQLFK